jgi:hypothetical protein
VTPEENQKSRDILKRAVVIASKHGNQVLDECNGSASVAATASAIMLSTFCSAAGMSMHEAMDLFMSVHKQTERMVKERT